MTNDFLILGSSRQQIFRTAHNYVAELFARACSEVKKKKTNNSTRNQTNSWKIFLLLVTNHHGLEATSNHD